MPTVNLTQTIHVSGTRSPDGKLLPARDPAVYAFAEDFLSLPSWRATPELIAARKRLAASLLEGGDGVATREDLDLLAVQVRGLQQQPLGVEMALCDFLQILEAAK